MNIQNNPLSEPIVVVADAPPGMYDSVVQQPAIKCESGILLSEKELSIHLSTKSE